MNYKGLCKRLIRTVRNYREEKSNLLKMYLEGEVWEAKAIEKLRIAKDQLDEIEFNLANHQELAPEKK